MKIDKEDLLRINKGFGGNIIRGSSLDYALEMQDNRKFGKYKKLAYLWRAILANRSFVDGKRTAAFLAFVFAEEHKKQADKELILHHAVSIAKNNITDIRNIERRLKNAIR